MSDLGDVVGIRGYRDFTVLGRGASSTVYRAFQEDFDRYVAVKVLNPDPDDPNGKRLAREKAIIGRLGNHPNIVQVFEAALTTDGHPYIAMQLYDNSLADHIATNGSLQIPDALTILADIAGAVHAAHQAGILHRDIKPQNILISPYGPGLADFGIARATTNLAWSQTLHQLTPLHAAPETFLDERPPDTKSDIWSLGSTLYTALAGRPPFLTTNNESISKYQLRLEQAPLPPIPRPDITPTITNILNQALAKNPDHRYPTAAHLQHALQTALNPNTTTPDPTPANPLRVSDDEPAWGFAEQVVTEGTSRRPSSRGPVAPTINPPTGATGTSPRWASVPAAPAGSRESSADELLAPIVGDGSKTTARAGHAEASDPPQTAEPPTIRLKWPIYALVGLVTTIAVIVAVTLLAPGAKVETPIKIPTSVGTTPVAASQGPTKFVVIDHGASVDLRWQDNSQGADSYIVYYQSAASNQPIPETPTPPSGTGMTIHDIDASLGYCFRLIGIGPDATGKITQAVANATVRGGCAAPTTTTKA